MNYSKQSAKSKLTGSEILDIRHLHDNKGFNDAQLGRLFAVSRKTIYNIVGRKTWKSIPTPAVARGFKGYTIYPDGRVMSKATGKFIPQFKGRNGASVRVNTSTGVRTTVPVSTLLAKYR